VGLHGRRGNGEGGGRRDLGATSAVGCVDRTDEITSPLVGPAGSGTLAKKRRPRPGFQNSGPCDAYR